MKGVVSQALLVSLSEVLRMGMSKEQVWGVCGMKAPSLWGSVNGLGRGAQGCPCCLALLSDHSPAHSLVP